MLSINQLDDEILAKILEYCPKTQESWIRLGSVCTKWRNVVEKHQGVFLVASGLNGDSNALLVKDVKGYSRVQVGAHCAKLPNMFEAGQGQPSTGGTGPRPADGTTVPAPQECGDSNATPSDITALQELQNKLSAPPDFVRKLCFMGNMDIRIPSSFLMMCKNLCGLHFHLSSLVGIPRSPDLLQMDIPTLQTLVIDSYGLEQTWRNGVAEASIKMTQVLDVALTLLELNTFLHLQTLILDIPLCHEKEKATVQTISKFLSRHGSLQSFCFHQGFVILKIDTESTEEDEDMESEDDEEVKNAVSLESLAVSSVELKKVSLKELHIGLYSPQESDPLWINFMIQQTKLEKLIFTGDRIPFPGITVRVNQSTLTTLIMEVRDNVDCVYLKDCAHLKKLSLLGKNEFTLGDEEDTFLMEVDTEEDNNNQYVVCKNVNIFNLQLLPVSLESLRINRLRIYKRDISEIICRGGSSAPIGGGWTHLHNLELIDCGVEGNLGVPLRAVAHILEKKNLKWFQIDYCLNRKSVHERNLPPPLEMLAYALKNNSISNFVLQGYLNANGIYEPCKPLPTHKTTEMFGGVEQDVFQFPEEIYPTGSHAKKEPEMKVVGSVTDVEESSCEEDSSSCEDSYGDSSFNMSASDEPSEQTSDKATSE